MLIKLATFLQQIIAKIKINKFIIMSIKMLKNFWLKIKPKIDATEKETRKLHRELWQDASWNTNYVVFTISACLIATFGLISNSTAVIIGAMIIAPLMLPLRAVAFAALEGDFALFRKGFISITGATILAIFLSYFVGGIASIPSFGSEVLSRTQPNLIDLGIAFVAGAISAFAKIRKEVSDALAGTAIAVALMPPLCVVGLSLSQIQFNLFDFNTYANLALPRGAFLLYLTNLLGIILACMIVFILAGYTEANQALGVTFALTGILFLPLGASFLRLVRQQQLETEITKKLVNETFTVGEGVDNTRITVDWNQNPPVVFIFLQTDKEITPLQAQLVQNFINKKMKKSFNLVFRVSKVKQIVPSSVMGLEADKKTRQININKSNLSPSPVKKIPKRLKKEDL